MNPSKTCLPFTPLGFYFEDFEDSLFPIRNQLRYANIVMGKWAAAGSYVPMAEGARSGGVGVGVG